MTLLAIRDLHHDASHEAMPHTHPQGQLFAVRAGLVSAVADGRRWVMPPGCLGWIPPGVTHGAVFHARTEGLNLYVDEAWSRRYWPDRLRVIRRTPLLTALLDTLRRFDSVPECYALVLADALGREPDQPLNLPMPADPRLAGLAAELLRRPDDDTGLDDWARRLGMTRRTLTRRFAAETGWSVGQWRQQARLLLAMERLAAGAAVTVVALDMGYQSVSAFIAMFKKYLGRPPGAWFDPA
ncbi:AraC family transcriptional regulator [Paludibacterium paludis]|uniref:AraC family transcriptional regulator n=1 Tax=Paludibacterium paludis TaxID=1225769 RepID=A0A918P1B1_9NEIS|nr:helix-turn-helix transcriptional regulator [Paludibacterium paludis]GGY11885.1 AraC family transcriptional regulator [Paludibacterium paludis]